MRKAKHGLTEWKVDKAFAGFTIFTPILHAEEQLEGRKESYVFLIDMKGDIVHHWRVPGFVGLHGELLPNGNLLCSNKTLDSSPSEVTFAATSVLELDWDSNIVWQYDDPMHGNHDRSRLQNGNTLIMRYDPMTEDERVRVRGGLPRSERDGVMYTFSLVEITPEGKEVDCMRLADILDPEIDLITPLATREEWPGLNSIEEMDDGKILSTSYNCSMIYIFDRKTRKVAWRYGDRAGECLSFPHDPTELDNSHILVFNNGRFHSADPNGHYNPQPPDFSRVMEIDPITRKCVWEYRADNPVDFYSTYISSAQRLPNGNTLICEGATGRIFEVTVSGEIVWEYISPVYSRANDRCGRTNCIYRAYRYAPDYPGLRGKKFDLEAQRPFNLIYGYDAMRAANQL